MATIAIPTSVPRATRARLNTVAGAAGLRAYQIYSITDEGGRLVIATSTSAYTDFTMLSEIIKGVAFSIGSIAANQVIAAPPSPYAFNVLLTSNLVFKSKVAATASTVYTLKNNGTAVATLTWAAAATTATAAFSSGTFAVAVNDFLTLEGPSSIDATLAYIGGRVTGT